MFEMDIKTIALIMFGIIILYLLYKTKEIEKKVKIDGFAVTDDMKKAINEIYNADIDAIRNLSGIATKISNTNNTLVLPANMTSMKGNAEIGGDTVLYGNLTVKGNVKFQNKDYGFMDIFPRFTILAFYDSMVPKGWAPCNGKYYKLNEEGVAIETIGGAYCPDLSGRMIIGTGKGTGLTERKRNDVGGFETHTLSVDEMPKHSHDLSDFTNKIGCKGNQCQSPYTNGWYSFGGGAGNGVSKWEHGKPDSLMVNTGPTGSGWPHPIMNPYFAMEYIMKL
jgi:microcystin-dependent protein